MTTPTTADQKPELRDFAIEAARLMADRRCEDVYLLDVRGISHVTDYILIGSGTSDRQMKTVASELDTLGRESGHECFRSNRDVATTWVVVDFVDLVVHIFEPAQREYYALEELWGDGLAVDWTRPAGDPPV
jgi:ribosome-associated protein